MKPGNKCPSCKTSVRYSEPLIDKDGNIICHVCKGIVFPVNENSHKEIASKMPVRETYHFKLDYDLNPVT